MDESLKRPEADQYGFVRTFNNTGYMTTYLDEVSQAWVDAAKSTSKPSADIGAAYGVATLAALRGSDAKIIAADLDPDHLSVLKAQAEKENIGARLTCVPGDFPDGLDSRISNLSLENILVCRVLHFFDGVKLQASINWCAQKLIPGGRLFLVCETPYLGNFKNFIPIYEKRKREGDEFPGFVDDVAAIAPDRAPFLPKQMHLLDAEVLSRVCIAAGLKLVRTVVIPRPNFPVDIQLDGRESVGLIARKPE